MKTVLVVDDVHECLFPPLKNLGYQIIYQPDATKLSIESLIPEISGLIIRSKFKVESDFFAKAKNLTFIGRAGAGLDLIDLDAAQKNKVTVFSANEGNKDALAEHVIGQLLMLTSKLKKADEEVRNGIWDREGNRGWELDGKTIGIIGYGHMGKAVAKRLKAFGMTILAYDKYFPSIDFPASLSDIFAKADILSLHVPLTNETKGMIDIDFLNQFKKPIILINSARGEILSLKTMLYGLRKGLLDGLILDVLPNEKLSSWTEEETMVFEQIKEFPQTIFSPHVAGWTTESYKKISEVLAAKIADFTSNELSK